MKLYKVVINWDNFKLLFTAPYYKQECSIIYYFNPKLKFKKSTKPEISTNVHPIPEKSTRFYQPDNFTKFHRDKISAGVY